ncbi:MAG: histidine kinase [Winogradskyella sp.]|nr:histidine kinase [Winogradskyella sp.]
MRRHIFFAFFTFLITAVLFGQQQKVDSLKQLILQSKQPDSTRVSNLLNLSYAINNVNSDSALVYVEKAMELSRQLNWSKGIALSNRQKGLVFYHKSDYFNALACWQKALDSDLSKNNKLFEASVYSNIGNLYADLAEYDKALESYEKFLDISKLEKSPKDELIATFSVATVYTEQGKYKYAINKFLRAYDLAEANNLDFYIPTICNNLSKTYSYLSDNEKAIKYLNIGIEKAENQNDIFTLALLKRNLAEQYFNKDDLIEAETLLQESISLSQSYKTLEREAQSLRLLYQIYEKQDKFKEALETHKTYISLRDSIINEDTKAEFIERNLTFESQKLKTLADEEIKRQKLIKNGSILGGSLLVVSAIFGLIVYKRKRDAISKKQKAEFSAAVANTELKALRAQMNPHFIFNSLNSINDYISKNDANSASKYLTKFAKIMRQTLENSNQKEITLQDDLQLIELYMQIEAMRLDNKFSYSIEVDEAIDVENTLVPPLILQPFIENSIWHGISKKEDKGHIKIQIKKDKDMIVCVVDDDGVGLKENKGNSERISLGQSITKDRIDIINKIKKTKGTVVIKNKPEGKGVNVEVKLPLEIAF